MRNAMTKIEKPSQILKQVRLRAGYRTAAAFARAKDEPETTYRAYENGSRRLTALAAKRLAPKLGLDDWRELIGDHAQAEMMEIDEAAQERAVEIAPRSGAPEIWLRVRVADDQDRAVVAAIADALDVSDPLMRKSVLQILYAAGVVRDRASD